MYALIEATELTCVTAVKIIGHGSSPMGRATQDFSI